MVDFLWLCYFTRVCQQCDSATLKQLHRSKIYSVAPSNTTSSNKVNHSQTQPHLAPHKWWHQDINEPAGIGPTNLNCEVPKNQRFAKNCPFQIGFFWKDKLSHVLFLQGAKYKIAKNIGPIISFPPKQIHCFWFLDHSISSFSPFSSWSLAALLLSLISFSICLKM